MSLTTHAKRLRAATAIALFSLSGVGQLAYAGPRNQAPVRFENSVSSIETAPRDYTSRNSAKRQVPADFFAYPDEPIPASFGLPSRSTTRVQTAALSTNYNLPFVDPVEYADYVKIGGSYTVNGVRYEPSADPYYNEIGVASWYGPGFHGNTTANGETYDMHDFTAAHPTLPLPCFAEVTNLSTGEKVVVRINDRGPFAKNRIIDLSRAAAEKVSVVGPGSAEVRVRYLGPAPREDAIPQQVYAETKPEPKQNLASAVKAALPDQFIQMGSFRDKSNAESLRSKLRTHDSSADIVFARVNGSKYYRVMLGPFNNKSDADYKLRQMSQLGFDGLVIRNP